MNPVKIHPFQWQGALFFGETVRNGIAEYGMYRLCFMNSFDLTLINGEKVVRKW